MLDLALTKKRARLAESIKKKRKKKGGEGSEGKSEAAAGLTGVREREALPRKLLERIPPQPYCEKLAE